MDKRGIVTGPHTYEKRELARDMRHEQTPAEQRLWQRLRRSQLGGAHFRRQQIIDGFIVDFYCHAAGLVVEIDGSIHAAQTAYDAERSQVLQRRGLRVLRFPNDRVMAGLDAVLAEIRACLPPGPLPAAGVNTTCQISGSAAAGKGSTQPV